jgi:alpha-tubulin suppressor-like RCC1 family protein
LVDMAGTHVHRAAVGATHMLAVDVKGQLYAWGANDKGQTGVDVASLSPEAAPGSGAAASATPAAVVSPRGGSVLTPVAVTLPAGSDGDVSVSVLAAGKAHSLVVDGASGSLWGWGSGARGVLGTGGETDQSAGPVRVEAAQLKGERIVHLDTAWTHSAAVTESGKLFMWGAKNNGRTGL